MTTSANPSKADLEPYSAAYLNDYRDFWWNDDFVATLAKRWQLGKYSKVLDVGCGTGHWGRKLLPHLPQHATIYGVDMEQEWVDKATEAGKKYPGRFDYRVSKGERIPFPDNSFDLVTCQAVLLHVDDAKVVMKEMLRVLQPGGQLIVAEPNHISCELLYDTVSINEDIQDIVKTIEFHLICEKGQRKIRSGFGSIGDLMPIYFKELGLKDIQVSVSDKAEVLIPPYDTLEQQLHIQTMKEWFADDLLFWSYNQTKQYYLAGEGDPAKFDEYWELLRVRFARKLKAIEDKTYSQAGGSMLYVVSGIKPGSVS